MKMQCHSSWHTMSLCGRRVSTAIGLRQKDSLQNKSKNFKQINFLIENGKFQRLIWMFLETLPIIQWMLIKRWTVLMHFLKIKIFQCKFKWISKEMLQQRQRKLRYCSTNLSIIPWDLIVLQDFNYNTLLTPVRSVHRTINQLSLLYLVKYTFPTSSLDRRLLLTSLIEKR